MRTASMVRCLRNMSGAMTTAASMYWCCAARGAMPSRADGSASWPQLARMASGPPGAVEIELVVDRFDDGVHAFQVQRARIHLLLQVAHAPAVQAPAGRQHRQQRAEARPPGLIPGRQEMQLHAQFVRTPGADPVAAAHVEAVAAGRHVGVGGGAVAGVGLDPVLVVAVETEGVAVARAGRIVERGDFHLDLAGAGRNFQRRGAGAKQCGRRHQRVVEPHRADHQRRLVAPRLRRPRLHHHVAARRAEHDVTGGGHAGRVGDVGLEHQPGRAVQHLQLQRRAVDGGDAVRRRYPHAPAAVGLQRGGVVGRQAGARVEPAETARAVGAVAVEDGDAVAAAGHP
ncbi:conserved hypothetical protein [Ricinus communis]|uniref:Uncharacterized protein n=1 Tax=Ricinus communis TaxID=3988 RepID=B9TA50_RICCO|nr:conserved hypothetical protein [Ricinus communis]